MAEKYIKAKELINVLMEKWKPDMGLNDLLLLIHELKIELDEKPDWIFCTDRLPVEKENPITMDFYTYPVKINIDGTKDIRFYSYGRGHWWYGPSIMDEYVESWLDVFGFDEHDCDKGVSETESNSKCIVDDTACMNCQCTNCDKNSTEECGNCNNCSSEENHQIWDFSCNNYKNE